MTMTKTNTTPKSRKPSAKAVQQPATPSVAAQLAAAQPQIAAKQAEKAPKASKTPDLKLVLTAKGAKFSPRGKSEVSKSKDQITWPKIQALFADHGIHTMAEVLALIPEHKDYVGYALRSGWLAPATQAA